MAAKFRYYIVDDSGNVSGTNSSQVAETAASSDSDVLVLDTLMNKELGTLGEIKEQATWLLPEPDDDDREPDESYNRDS
jgi:hypothetical protein